MPPPSSSQYWLILVVIMWLQAINGPNSNFPVYSSQLKQLKHLSQVQLNFLAVASDAGKLLGWLPGVAALYLPLWLVAVVGAAMLLTGYGIQYLCLDSAGLRYWHLFLLTFLPGNGICWINTVCNLVCVRNMSGSSSRAAVGLTTSYLGLSAKVYMSLAGSIPGLRSSNNKVKAYLLLNAVVPMVVTVVVSLFLTRVVDFKSYQAVTDGGAAFLFMFLIALATGAFVIVVDSTSNGLPSKAQMIILSVLLVALPVFIPVALWIRERTSSRESVINDLSTDEAKSMDVAIAIDVDNIRKGETTVEKPHEEVNNIVLLLRKLDFWLYLLSYMLSGTMGLMFFNNLGQIAESRGLEVQHTSKLLSLSSSFIFFGRLIPCVLDYYSVRRGCFISSTKIMAFVMVPMVMAFFLLLNPSNSVLYPSTGIIGACTGAITSLAVSATAELFGTTNFAVNHNLVVANIPVGSLCFGYLAAFLYQRGAPAGSHQCVGAICYKVTFIIWGTMCILGIILCAVLLTRTSCLAPEANDGGHGDDTAPPEASF